MNDASVAADQVASLDELDAHRAGEQRVLEVGRVVDAGREHDDGRVADADGADGAQRGEQLAGSTPTPDGPGGRRTPRAARADALGGCHDVGDAGRDAHVVLEHPEVAVARRG